MSTISLSYLRSLVKNAKARNPEVRVPNIIPIKSQVLSSMLPIITEKDSAGTELAFNGI